MKITLRFFLLFPQNTSNPERAREDSDKSHVTSGAREATRAEPARPGDRQHRASATARSLPRRGTLLAYLASQAQRAREDCYGNRLDVITKKYYVLPFL